jgi:hypothetical protein
MKKGLKRFRPLSIASAMCSLVITLTCSACGGGGGIQSTGAGSSPTVPTTTLVSGNGIVSVPSASPTGSTSPKGTATASPIGTRRSAFLGAFFRAAGAPPYGIFSPQSPSVAPSPYPQTGSSDYCTHVAANGYSIQTGNLVDSTKLANVVNLGVGWVRTAAPQFFDDLSHVWGAGSYQFADFDSAQCSALVEHGIKPVVGLEAGPVQYSAVLGQLPPQQAALYQTPSDFGTWCGAVAAHERAAFPTVNQFSLPGNEVNSNPQLFPGGNAQIAAYSEACYAAIKSAYPSAYVYGFELNMDGSLNAPAFVQQMAALGCRVGTCYDGIALHLSLRYPAPAATTPCYPNAGGDYVLQCVNDIISATQSPVHVLVSETVYPVPGFVPDESTKALAVVNDLTTFAADPSIEGVSYADVDECALYPSGFFFDGCLISTSGQILPAYTALQQLATVSYR